MRVLDAFRKHDIAKRKFSIRTNKALLVTVGSVELRLFPDLQVNEADDHRMLFFNFRIEKLDDEDAQRTIEIAHWVAEQNSVKLPIGNIEFIDLCTGNLHTIAKRRAATTRAVKANAQPIAALWASL